MTPIEAAAAALELAQRLAALAQLELRPRSNAAAILEHHSEAGQLTEQLRFYLLTMDVPA